MDAILGTGPALLQEIFGTAADRLARQTGFVRRLRRLTPAAFAQAFCLFLIRYPEASLEQLAAQLHITAGALCQRLRQSAAADYLRGLLAEALGRLAAVPRRRVAIPLLRRFNGVYLVDGTTLPLPAALAGRFAGCGGGAGPDDPSAKAAVKVLWRWRLDTGAATELMLAPARTPDAHLLRRLPPPPPGALHIGDLGFFDGRSLAALVRRGVSWLTRLPARVCVRQAAGGWRELAVWLDDLGRRGADRWEGPLEVGRLHPVPARVCVLRCPPAETARRRRKLRQHLRRKGRAAGWRQLTLCGWWVLATDVPEDKLRAAEAWELYRCRWQIELVFKRWKSLGGLDIDRRFAATRAECVLYGKLLGLLLIDWLALQRGGPLAGVSPWRAWQIVHEFLPPIGLALLGRLDWTTVLTDLLARLAQRHRQPRRKKTPSTRQRLFRATLAA